MRANFFETIEKIRFHRYDHHKKNQYTMEDARRKRESMEYFLIMTRVGKTKNMPVSNQITFIYTGIELKFRRDLSKPSEKIIMEAYFQKYRIIIKISGE